VADHATRVEKAVLLVRRLETEISQAQAALEQARAEVIAARDGLFKAFPELKAGEPEPAPVLSSVPYVGDDPEGPMPGPNEFRRRV
jgi:hypothetical protein